MFALHRFVAVLMKEFVQMRRDRLTFAMMIGVPIMQLVLFGFAINTDPRRLPTAVVARRREPVYARSLVRALENTGYFKIVGDAGDGGRGRARCWRAARCSSCSQIPEDFSRKLQRGERAGGAGRGRRHRPRRDRQRARRAAAGRARPALDHDLTGPARARCKPARAALRDPRAPPLQPRGHHAVQHRARPDGRGAHDDHGDDDRASP